MSIVLIAGIPFDGAFWNEVKRRLDHHNMPSTTWTLCQDNGSMGEQIQSLKKFIESNNIETVVAHGLSVPVAIEASHIASNTNLIVSNGLLTPTVGLIRWVLPRLQQIPCTLKQQLLRPSISLPILASSGAFRRLVINPYVMERSTLRNLSEDLLAKSDYRSHLCSYLSSLESWTLNRAPNDTLTHAIWGDQDLLFPIEQLEAAQVKFPDFIKTIRQIDGGAHFHPIERPWSIADAIHQILTN